jgi:hypothetical protein
MNAISPLQPNYARATVALPEYHKAQAKLRWLMSQTRFVAARCGRRFGKNVLGEGVAIDDASHGRLVGWFAPENKRLSESYQVIREALHPIVKSSDKTRGMIRTITGGAVEFWSLEDENAGRSRKYHRIIGDEVAFTKPNTINWWKRSARPTLVDYRGRALMMSNTAGIDPENFLYEICHDVKHGFVQFHAPSRSNPFLPADEVAAFERDNEPLVYQQEYLADFVDWSGAQFFALDKMLQDGNPVEWPLRCEAIFATIDSASKTGTLNDGTGVVWWALIRNNIRPVGANGLLGPAHRLVILDWDVVQIEGAMLETWLPGVFDIGTDAAIQCKASKGFLGAFIEDKSSGTILLQQAKNRGLRVFPIDSKLTAMGKDERAISVSGYFYRGLVKISRQAFTKTKNYKGKTLNHFRSQVVGFKIGDKDARKRQDDLLDCATYGAAIALGNSEGF